MSNYCTDCGEPFEGYGAYCPDCLPAQSQDEQGFHQFCAKSQSARAFDERLASDIRQQRFGEDPYYVRR